MKILNKAYFSLQGNTDSKSNLASFLRLIV